MSTDRNRQNQSSASVQAQSEQRIERLSRREPAAKTYGAGYTKFVRTMRLVLPLIAAGIVMVLFLWPAGRDEAIVPVAQERTMLKDQKIAKNELINPQFESADKKNNPYKISAARAIQGEKNEDLIMLEKPVGVMTMEGGAKIEVTSLTGAYRRDTERFFLSGQVDFLHDKGYRLRSEEAHIDLRGKLAWTERAVQATGPDLSIDAKGMTANSETGEVVFSGPAKLVLTGGIDGL
ncbi:MAG: LPS export ABC transporter periplasmic protein LptC [Alphaproteobacteria bacterium]|nr:LPS export ABC transporter periplasmic protein LptC [Alphaproteobacteria bacterium]